jgi:hypothetical protein
LTIKNTEPNIAGIGRIDEEKVKNVFSSQVKFQESIHFRAKLPQGKVIGTPKVKTYRSTSVI